MCVRKRERVRDTKRGRDRKRQSAREKEKPVPAMLAWVGEGRKGSHYRRGATRLNPPHRPAHRRNSCQLRGVRTLSHPTSLSLSALPYPCSLSLTPFQYTCIVCQSSCVCIYTIYTRVRNERSRYRVVHVYASITILYMCAMFLSLSLSL